VPVNSLASVHPLWLLAVSLAIGLLIGVERGWSRRDEEEGTRVAGVRTYALLGLLGGVAGLIAQHLGAVWLGATFVGVAAALVVAQVLRYRHTGDLGVTSLVAGLLTFSLGALASFEWVVPAVAGAVVTTLLLSYKPRLHAWLAHLRPEELQAALKLLLISLVLLPILPDRGYGPWEALNPYQIGWMVVLIAAISFVGYLSVKVAGARRGLLLTALAAGLVSSTALTLHFARLARVEAAPARLLAAGVLLACGTMFPRMFLVSAAVDWPLAQRLAGPLAAMAVAVYLAAAWQWWHTPRDTQTAERASEPYRQSPLELGSAFRFGVLLALIMLAAEALRRWWGETGVYLVAALSGISDVDAITLSLSRLAGEELALGVAAMGVVLAAVSNNLVKAGIAAAVSHGRIAVAVVLPLVVASALGVALAWWG